MKDWRDQFQDYAVCRECSHLTGYSLRFHCGVTDAEILDIDKHCLLDKKEQKKDVHTQKNKQSENKEKNEGAS